jgi:hypothetical protein
MKSSKKRRTTQAVSHQKPQFYVQPSSGFCWIPPVMRRLFEVNSEPHTGVRPSVRLRVGLINKPLAAFPPSVRLKEHQTKHTSLIPTERLQ